MTKKAAHPTTAKKAHDARVIHDEETAEIRYQKGIDQAAKAATEIAASEKATRIKAAEAVEELRKLREAIPREEPPPAAA